MLHWPKKSLVMPFYYINFDQNGPPYFSLRNWPDRYVRGTFLATRPTSYGSTTKKQQHSPENPASYATFLLSKSLEQVRGIQKLAFWRF